jgi:hypothetical protein
MYPLRDAFDDWRRVFSQVCAYSPDKIKGLGDFYGFGKNKLDPDIPCYMCLLSKFVGIGGYY